MLDSKLIRKELEEKLHGHINAAFEPHPYVHLERVASGISSVDSLLHGGLPAGTLTEFVGKCGSGRTSAALAYISAHTRMENVCAWIDVSDALDPESAAANGVDLERLLWVRCGSPIPQHNATQPIASQEFVNSDASADNLFTSRPTGGGSPHPRSEGRDMPQAISSILQAHGGLYDKQVRREKRFIGTPGVPNRPLTYRSEDREEQVNSDRLPPRRGDNLNKVRVVSPLCAEPQTRRVAALPFSKLVHLKESSPNNLFRRATSPWKALDQALRATDLLLHGGGFSAIVLDLGNIPPEIAWRVPLATWFRFRAACVRTRVSLVLLTQYPCARSSAELVVRFQTGTMEAESRVMTGIRYHAAIERSRSYERESRVIPIRKPPKSELPGEWKSEASWA